MGYKPLTKEQYMEAREAGFSHQRIIEMEQKRKSLINEEPGFFEKVGDFLGLGGLAKGITQSIFFKTKEGKETLKRLERGEINQSEFDEIVGGGIAKPREVIGSAAQTGLTIATAGGAGTGGKLLTRAVKSAGLGMGFSAAGQLEKEGKVTPDVALLGATIGSAIPVGGALFKKASNALTQLLPERIVQSVLRQTPKAKLAGKDVSKFVLGNKRVGTANKLIDTSVKEISKLEKQIQTALKGENKKVINPRDIVNRVARRLNKEGGYFSSEELSDIISKLAPKSRALLQKEKLSPKIANNLLRKPIDDVLGERAFINSQIPFNKEVLRAFNNELRETVKTLVPTTRKLFETQAKEITLRDALIKQTTRKSGNSIFSLSDIIYGVGGFAGGGVPGTLGAVAAKRALQSTPFKTGSAVLLNQMGKIQPILDKLAPAERTIIMELIANSQKE